MLQPQPQDLQSVVQRPVLFQRVPDFTVPAFLAPIFPVEIAVELVGKEGNVARVVAGEEQGGGGRPDAFERGEGSQGFGVAGGFEIGGVVGEGGAGGGEDGGRGV